MFPYSKNLWDWKKTTKNSNIEPRELDKILCAFILALKKKIRRRGVNEPTTLRSFVSSFDRYLRKKGYPTAIIEGQEFRKTRETLVAKQKELKKVGKGNKTKADRALTDDIEVYVLYSKELLGLSSPESLLNTLWLNNSQYFGLRGCQEHRNMRWAMFTYKPVRMEQNFSNIPKDKQKPERKLNRKTFAQLNQQCFLSRGVTEIHYKPSTFMLLKDRNKWIQRTARFI